MPMNWKPDVWSELASNKPDVFIKELLVQKPPRANLLTETYLECVSLGFRALSKHKNSQYETQFFQRLTQLMPAMSVLSTKAKYEMERLRFMDADRTPIEFLAWYTALKGHFNPAKTMDYHGWLLTLRKPTYDPHDAHPYFSLDNAPEWAAGYVRIQRGGSPTDLLSWLGQAPVGQSLGVLNAMFSLHREENPGWLNQCALAVLARTADIHKEASVYDALTAVRYAWRQPSASPQLDDAIVAMMRDQPEGMSFMSHAWFGGHYGEESYTSMLSWWDRQTPTERGDILHRWLASPTSWNGLTKEVPKEKKPGMALDLFSAAPVELLNSQAKAIVQTAPIEDTQVRQCLSKFIPVLLSAELMVDPDKIKPYLLHSWDVLHAKTEGISVEGLLDFEP